MVDLYVFWSCLIVDLELDGRFGWKIDEKLHLCVACWLVGRFLHTQVVICMSQMHSIVVVYVSK